MQAGSSVGGKYYEGFTLRDLHVRGRSVVQRRSIQKEAAGFTLVELLVVVGIIALLIGFLMPSINKARNNAVRVSCRAQLADIGRLFTMYLNDSKNHLPRVNTMPSVVPPMAHA